MTQQPPPPSVPTEPGWRLASAGPTLGLRFLGLVYRVLPLRLAQYLIWGMIWGWFQHFNHPRLSVIRAMERMGQPRPYWAAYRVFLNYGFMLVERFYTYAGRVTLQIEQGPAARASARLMEVASAAPGPLVVLSSHCGAVEHTAVALEGLGRNVRAVAIRDEGAATLLAGVGDPSVRLGAGRTIVADGSLRAGLKMLQALKKGDILAFKADRALPGASEDEVIELPVFGAPARLPLGPAKLICVAKARALVISVFRTGRARYIALADELDTSSGDPATLMREYIAIQERHLRQYPDQWFNFYPYWPEDEAALAEIPSTVPPAMRAAEPAVVSTFSATLAIGVLAKLFALTGAHAILTGWPAIGLALLLGALAGGLSMWVIGQGKTLAGPIASALAGGVLAASIVAILAAGPTSAALALFVGSAASLGALIAWLHERNRLIGLWVLALLAVVSWTF